MKAFPTTMQSWDIYNGRDLSGMDLRDYFAAKAMQALITNSVTIEEIELAGAPFPDVVSMMAYEVADKMMEERNGNA